MIKNMTRKGLAIGATAALTLAGLVGIAAPASATTGITVEPSKGTSYTMISGEQLSLRVFGQANYTGGFSALKWHVSNPDGATVEIFRPAASGDAASATPSTALPNGEFNPAGTSNASSATSFVVSPSVIATATGANQLGVKVADTVATTLQVRAFIDLNGNGTYDAANDLTANVATVVFVKKADLTANVAITAPTEGDTTVTASVEFNVVNNEQLDPAKVAATFTKGDGSALTAANVASTNIALTSNVATVTTAAHGFAIGQRVTMRGFTGGNAVLNGTHTLTAATSPTMTFALTNANIASAANTEATVSASTLSDSAWSATKKFEYVATPAAALVKGQSVKVQAVFGGTNIGVAATANISARVAETVTASVVKSLTAGAAGAPLHVLNRGTFEVKALVVDGSSPVKPVAGLPVTAKIESSRALSSTITVSVGSTTYTSSAALPGATNVARLAVGSTNAAGEVTLAITTAGTTEDDTITVTFYVENLSDDVVATLKDASYTGYVENVNGGTAVTTDGTATNVNVVVLDQFGGAAPAGYKATAVFNAGRAGYVAQATTASTAASGAEVTLVNGRGTLSILDNGTGNGTNAYDLGFNTGAVGASTTTINSGGANAWLLVKIVPAVNAATGSFTVTDGTTALALNTAGTELVMTAGQRGATNTLLPLQTVNGGTPVTFKNFDARAERGAAAPNVIADNTTNRSTVAGVISSTFSATAAAAVVPNASVTVSGEGLLFQTAQNGTDVYGKDSLTFNANGSGAFSVKVYSQKAGKNLVTITSGSVSRVVALNTAAASAISGASWSAPSVTVPAGRSFSVSATLLDRFGNAVDTNQGATVGTDLSAVRITWNGPVLTVPTTLPTETDADGVIRFGVVPGAADVGTYTAVFTYGGADGIVGGANAADDVSVSVTVVIGSGSVSGEARAWTRDMGDGTIKIYARDVVGAGKIQFFHNGREVAWVNATSANDPKLNVASDGMVRTRALVSGRNVFEIYVDGERIVRRIATGS
jgi:hypothetical protein